MQFKLAVMVAWCLSLGACGGGGGGSPAAASQDTATAGASPTLGACSLFPAAAIFNTRIDALPTHASSSTWVNAVGTAKAFHPDWGRSEDQAGGAYYGIPYNVVDGTSATTAWPQVTFTDYGEESDCAAASGSGHEILQGCANQGSAARFPYPSAASTKFEGGACPANSGCGDRHVLVVETGRCRLWESANAYAVSGGWQASGAAAWDLHSLAMRPDTWTSSDAAGMPITPLLVKAAEAQTEIRHALRVTFPDAVLADRAYVWPASHAAGSSGGGPIPYGSLLRLKASFAIPSGWDAEAKAIALAMQRYGLYVVDNGSALYVQGEPSAAWRDTTLDQLKTLTMASFEFVDTSPITGKSGFNPRSYAASW